MDSSVTERMPPLVAYLREQRPDVVALQEVGPWGSASQAHYLAEGADYRVCLVRSAPDGDGEGLAVLATADCEPRPTVHLPSAADDHPRALQQVDVRLPAGVVRIANTHLAWRLEAGEARALQAEVIAAALEQWPGPLVLLGDINDVAGSPAVRALEHAGLVDAYAAVQSVDRETFAAANPYLWQQELAGRRVDHILVRGLKPVDAEVVLTGEDAPIVSDHYGVRATVARR